MKLAFICLICVVFFCAHAHAEEKIGVGSFASSLSCDTANSRLKVYETLSPLDKLETSTVLARCAAIENNKENPNDPVIVQVQPAPKDGESRVLFNIIHVKDANNVVEGCAGALTIAGMVVGDTEGQLAGAFGKMTCSAYYEAAAKNDPLLVLAPAMIPGDKVTRDVLARVGLGEAYDKAKSEVANLGSKAAGEAKKHPDIIIAPTIVAPIKIACKLLKC